MFCNLLFLTFMVTGIAQAKDLKSFEGQFTWDYKNPKSPKCVRIGKEIIKELRLKKAECVQKDSNDAHDQKGGIWFSCSADNYWRYIYQTEKICMANLEMEQMNGAGEEEQ